MTSFNALSPKVLAALLEHQGRHGDSLLVHVGPQEAKLLRKHGGAGTRNPVTGLLEYYGSDVGGPDTSDVGGPGNIGGGAGARADAGARSGGRDGGGDGNGGLMAGASGAYNSSPALQTRDPITSAALANQREYADSSGPMGALGKYALGIGWMDPTQMNQSALRTGVAPPTSPDYGIDALGAGLGIAGLATGLPLGTAYAGLKTIGAVPSDFGMIDLGQWSDRKAPTPSVGGRGSQGGGPAVPSAGGISSSGATAMSDAYRQQIINQLLGISSRSMFPGVAPGGMKA